MSMMGITLATLGVEREKNKVASLSTWMNVRISQDYIIGPRIAYLENLAQLFDDLPLLCLQLEIPDPVDLVRSEALVRLLVCENKAQHVVSGVPSGSYIAGYISDRHFQLFKAAVPCW